jgi:hypothetical protein
VAETLGSLADKLAIKAIREYHLKEKYSAKDKRLKLVRSQKKDLTEEIDSFIKNALKGRVRIREQKIKLYNPKDYLGKIPQLKSIAEATSCLVEKNLELWHLEDEARRRDVGDAYIGRVKRKIDLTNQQRNDLIDKVDELLAKTVNEKSVNR